MLHFRLIFTIFTGLLICASVFAQEQTVTTITTSPSGVVEKKVIVTTVPAPKEVIAVPTGYVTCFTVKAGWYQDVWVAERNVCQYANSPSGVAWVEGHWVCNKYDAMQGHCTNWDWKAARWEKTLTVY